jgi:KipI family sensor histidine kinase inhibitor
VSDSPLLLPLGDSAWTVEFGDRIDPALHARVMGLNSVINAARDAGDLAGITDLVPTFRSLTVHYDPQLVDAEQLGTHLLQFAKTSGRSTSDGRRWLLPVCCDAEMAPDLERLAEAKRMAPETVIARLAAATFRVYMIGFMPGFPYMGGLPAELAMPRLASPRKTVPARSLAVTGEMCAVYPWESPGGWNLLGRTPVALFDAADEAAPALLESGDQVRWRIVDRAEYDHLEGELAGGRLGRADFLVAKEAAWPA